MSLSPVASFSFIVPVLERVGGGKADVSVGDEQGPKGKESWCSLYTLGTLPGKAGICF